jgi:hypothetical protein
MQSRSKRSLLPELNKAVEDGDADEVMALLQLMYPDRPVIFKALSTGCVATVQSVLARGGDANERMGNFSALSATLIAAAQPLPLFRADAPNLPAFSTQTAVSLVRALLEAGATPTAEDLRTACSCTTAEIGKLLLAFRCPLFDEKKDGFQPPLVLTASACCPDLIFPLLEYGAAVPTAFPKTTNPGVFKEAYWKQVRMLYLLHHRSCVRVHNDVLARIAAFLAKPIRVQFVDVEPVAPPPPIRLADLLMPLQVC